MRTEEWQQDKLFDAWNLTDIWIPKEFVKPEEWAEFETSDIERWGVLTAKRAIFQAMPTARVIHRGDAPVWDEGGQGGYMIQGDLDVSWEGRSPIFEVKSYSPAIRLRQNGKPIGACQGLDWPRRHDYLNEQKRSGRPFYVLWCWPDVATRTRIVRGARVDRLRWPPDAESLNRRRNVKGAKMAYWYVDSLWPISRIAEDISGWTGAPYQTQLVA